jgi:hypothetical protein
MSQSILSQYWIAKAEADLASVLVQMRPISLSNFHTIFCTPRW